MNANLEGKRKLEQNKTIDNGESIEFKISATRRRPLHN